MGPPLSLGLSRAVQGKPVVADNLRALPPAPVPPFTAALGHPVIWPPCQAMYEASPPRLSGALAPGRVGCGRATSSVCRRATSTRADYDHVQTSDGVGKRCFTRHCGLDASRPGAWSFTGDPRTPAVDTSLDAWTRMPSTCTGSDRDRRESAREKAIHEHSTVAHGRWTMQCPSDGEPPRTAAHL